MLRSHRVVVQRNLVAVAGGRVPLVGHPNLAARDQEGAALHRNPGEALRVLAPGSHLRQESGLEESACARWAGKD